MCDAGRCCAVMCGGCWCRMWCGLVMDGNMREFRDSSHHFRKSYLLLIIHDLFVLSLLLLLWWKCSDDIEGVPRKWMDWSSGRKWRIAWWWGSGDIAMVVVEEWLWLRREKREEQSWWLVCFCGAWVTLVVDKEARPYRRPQQVSEVRSLWWNRRK